MNKGEFQNYLDYLDHLHPNDLKKSLIEMLQDVMDLTERIEELKREELEFLDSLTKRKTMSQGTLEIIFRRIKQIKENLK